MDYKTRVDGSILVFELKGNVDFESAIQFGSECRGALVRQGAERIVFNMSGLRFVGSSAINQFIKLLKDLNSNKVKPRYCHLSWEFERLFRTYEASRKPFEIFPSEPEAKASFDAPVLPRRRGRRALNQ